ncbi:MAG: alpha/beta fold hydrolase [Bradymonadaceae bacterium]
MTELQQGVGTSPLIVVHASAGTVFEYRKLVEAFDDSIPVIGIQSPGFGAKDAIPESIDRLAQHYVEDLSEISRLDECRLIGWSFGGVVAFELASALRDHGLQVDHLCLLDAFHPSLRREMANTRGFSVLREFVVNVGRTAGLSPAAFEALTDLLETEDDDTRILEKLASHLETMGGPTERRADRTFLEQLFTIYRTHMQAYDDYHPKPTDVPTTVVAAKETGSSHQNLPGWRGWKSLIEAPKQQVSVEAGHYQLLQPPALKKIIGYCSMFSHNRRHESRSKGRGTSFTGEEE